MTTNIRTGVDSYIKGVTESIINDRRLSNDTPVTIGYGNANNTLTKRTRSRCCLTVRP
ncbi:hypothetical protein D3C71_898720 [compost metagenome]